ncbi:metallophosphoesterase [Halomarina ordinaria]|uniref:Metallophosphoesterase n=1 Tax=Halomarina ordinaria TaxID=3033939 RepID=A0ABD5U580_9EURY|nr:metallophosphoesterase [Halomarina sp. PSRA2]
MFEPVPGEPAAVATLGDERALVVADYHAGLEVALRSEGVELRSRAEERRAALLDLLDRTRADRVVFLGDLANAIGRPGREETRELERLLEAVARRVPVTVVKGNHDGEMEAVLSEVETARTVEVTPGHGTRVGDVGFVHGHTWPSPRVLEADVVAMGHEHPKVRLEDEVGGHRAERAWLRGRLVADPFEGVHEGVRIHGELVVCPAFNDLLGGTWTNTDQGFLAPYLPEGLADAQAYLLDGTRLGAYTRV